MSLEQFLPPFNFVPKILTRYESPGPAVYGRDAKPVADDKIPLMAREAEPEPARFQPLGEIRRDSTPAPTEE